MAYYIGVMSGTSMDGIDIALCEFDRLTCKALFCCEYPFEAALKRDILGLIERGGTLQHIGALDQRLGVMYAEAISAFMKAYGIDAAKVCAIGLHGQTLWHEPEGDTPFSMQLGDANVVAARCGITTVADFRRMDMALGGQGAPFAPAFHRQIFGTTHKAVLNIGGIANVTFLDEPFIGFDTGVGNMLMDYWCQKHHGMPYDKAGSWAASGSVDATLLQRMLHDPYFHKRPPKSTGREYFSASWLEAQLQGFTTLAAKTVQSTLLQLTVESVAKALSKRSVDELIVCGGGAKNAELMYRLQRALPSLHVSRSDDHGYSGDFLEAMAFAWLAYQRLERKEVPLKAITGASKDALLGAVYG